MSTPPTTRRDDRVEVLHGRPIADPYRWLEDPDDPETVDWVRRQNGYAEEELDGLPGRAWFAALMHQIIARPRAGVPFRRSGRYFVTRNDGTQDQDVVHQADSLAELLAGGRVLLDPNTWSTDGTAALTSFTVSSDGRLAAYGVSEAGSDWERFRILDLATGAELDEPPVITKFSEPAWLPDGRSYLYVQFDRAGADDGTETTILPGGTLRIHRLGTPQADDELVLGFPENQRLIIYCQVTDDGAYAVVTVTEGTENRGRLSAYPITDAAGRSELGEPIVITDEPIAEFGLIRSDGPILVLRTDLAADRGRVVSVDLDRLSVAGEPEWVEVWPESEHTLVEATAAGDGLLLVHLVDAQPVLTLAGRDGTSGRPVATVGGALVGLDGHAGSDEVFVGFSTVTEPTSSFRLDAGTAALGALPELVVGASTFSPPETVVERRRADQRRRRRRCRTS